MLFDAELLDGDKAASHLRYLLSSCPSAVALPHDLPFVTVQSAFHLSLLDRLLNQSFAAFNVGRVTALQTSTKCADGRVGFAIRML